MSVHAVPDPPPDRTSKEPAMRVAGLTALGTVVTAIVGLLLAFGVGVSERQATAILGVVFALAAAAPLVSGWFTRGRVYAPATVAKMIDATVAETLDEAQGLGSAATRSRWPAKEL